MSDMSDKCRIKLSGVTIDYSVSKETATRDHTELVEKFKILERRGEVGGGTNYVLIGS